MGEVNEMRGRYIDQLRERAGGEREREGTGDDKYRGWRGR